MRASAGAGLALAATGVGAATNAQDAYAPLGSVQLSNAREAVVSDDGETAYVAEMDGFTTVDVSDPETPEVVATVTDVGADQEDGPLTGLQDIKVDGDRLIVAGPPNSPDGSLSGFGLYDVSNPADPQQVAFYETTAVPGASGAHNIHNCYLDGDTAYLTGTDFQVEALVVVDVSNDRPERIATWDVTQADDAWDDVNPALHNLHDVYVQDGRAYLSHWDAGAWVLDVSDPASPSALGRVGGLDIEELASLSGSDLNRQYIEPPGNAHYAQPTDDGSVLFVGGESWDTNTGDDSGGPSNIDVWDISDPASPERLARIAPPLPRSGDTTTGGTWTTPHNFDVVGDRLYSSWYQGGVKIHDISDPANPEELAWWRSPDDRLFWTAQLAVEGDFFVASTASYRGSTPGLHTFPDSAGEMADPPGSLVAGGSQDDPSDEQTDDPTDEPTDEPTEETPPDTDTQAGETTAPGGETAAEDDEDEPGTTDVNGPGFGLLAGAAGVGLGAARYLRENGDD